MNESKPFYVDIAYKSLNKYKEELCGDKVEVVKTKDSDIIILADGMGSGVKANILSTLTSKILGTMLLNGATIDECVKTIVKTLPVCKERQVAYSTFSILQIFKNKDAYLVEFDNPPCIFIRDKELMNMMPTERIIEGKKVKEYRFKIKQDDCFILMSDGAIHAGVGQVLNFGWTWKHIAEYAVKNIQKGHTATRFANFLNKACEELYMGQPGDDTTIAVTKVTKEQCVNLLTGPPENKEDDKRMVKEFMKAEGKKVVCGGTTANIVSRILKKKIHTTFNYPDPNIPPTASIEGLNLVTEGVITLNRTLSLLKRYLEDFVDENYFLELDRENGGSLVAKILIEECTKLNLYVGKSMNIAHQNPDLPFDLSIRMNIVDQIKETVTKMGKEVTITYY